MIDAALVHEAVLVYSPAIDTLLSALTHAMAADDAHAMAASDGRNASAQWRFVSDRPGTLKDVASNGGVGLHIRDADAVSYQHFNFEREALFGPYVSQTSDPLP